MSESKQIIIVGGHGKIALMAAKRLCAAGDSVTSLIRNFEHSTDVGETGAVPVVLDIETEGVEQLIEAFSSADAVVFSAGAGGGNPARTHAVDFIGATKAMEAAERADVSRFVMVSYSHAAIDIDRLNPDDSFTPYARAKHDADAVLRLSSLDYTILGPGPLTLEPASGRILRADDTGAVDGRELTREERATSRENVAAVIEHVLSTGAAIRQTVNFYDGDTPIAEAIPAAE